MDTYKGPPEAARGAQGQFHRPAHRTGEDGSAAALVGGWQVPTIAKTPPALGWFAVLVDARLRLLNFADAKLPFALDCVGTDIARSGKKPLVHLAVWQRSRG